MGLAALSACASRPPPPPTLAAPAPVPESIDGQYHGIARLVRADVRGCPRSGPRTITVTNESLSLTYRGPTVSYSLVGMVGPDGSIHGSDGRGTVDGQITGRHMDLTVSSASCEVRYALERM
jgi:hypothetical protein